MEKDFIKINDKGQLKITLTLDSIDKLYFGESQVPNFMSFKESAKKALIMRIKKCEQNLLSDILTSDDVVFNGISVFSNKRKLTFSVYSYKRIKELLEKVEYASSSENIFDFINKLKPEEKRQLLKAFWYEKNPANMCFIEILIDSFVR